MEQNINNKIEIKDKLKNFYNKNKFKIYTIVFVLISVFFVFIIYKVNLQKKNELISENYIKAGLYLNSGKKKESLDIYEKIILSGNKFYSILALSNVLEKNLITDQKIILDYFLIVKEKVKLNDQKDLLTFKKALYLIKNQNNNEAEKLLKNLINNNSKFKSLAEEIITK